MSTSPLLVMMKVTTVLTSNPILYLYWFYVSAHNWVDSNSTRSSGGS